MITNPRIKELYFCDGVVNEYPVTIAHYEDELLIKHRDYNTKLIVVLEKGVDWTFQSDSSGDTIITTEVYPIGDVILINTDSPYTQEMDLIANDPLPPEALELAMDKLTVLARQTNVNMVGSMVLPEMLFGVYELPMPKDRANKLLIFDNEGKPIPAASVPEGTVVFSPFGELLVASVDADTARILLEVHDKVDVYTKTEVYNKSEVYVKADVYTKAETNAEITADVEDLAGAGRTTETVKANADAIQNAFGTPLGYVYTQYPGQLSPVEMNLKGTWDDITDQYAGLFFRAEGSRLGEGQDPGDTPNHESAPFDGSVQFDLFQGHHHTITPNQFLGPGGSVSGNGDDWDWDFPVATDAITDGTNGTPRTGRETRPVNTSIRIWKRIA